MVSLRNIEDYVSQTAHIIGGVSKMDVLIVDHELRIIGDSDLESRSTGECIRKDSILARVMEERESVIITSLDDHAGCRNCLHRDTCVVEMIIGIPIVFEERILGSVGMIANTPLDKNKMVGDQEQYIQFIGRMIELIVNKLKEERAFSEISIMKKRLEVVLDSIDNFLLLVSEEGQILQSNLKFNQLFGEKGPSNIGDFLDDSLVEQILNAKEDVKYKEIKLGKTKEFVLTSKIISEESKKHGIILSIRSLKAIAKEMNDLYTHSMDVAFEDLLGESAQIINIKERIRQIAPNTSTVLIDGETGTGKEVVARLIHNTSKRAEQPFVAINCSAIPEELMESELFGYEEGAFSGAKKGGKIGKFQLADGGTLFLDEVGEMALHLQAKLLRVLQEKRVTKIGGLESTQVDVRILAATNRRLEELVAKGNFREDLYYRLKVIPLTLPPLRERIGDLPILINHFVDLYSDRIGKEINGVTEDAMETLLNHPWKGNVRELRNSIEFAINMATTDMITINALPYDMLYPTDMQVEEFNIDLVVKGLIEKALDKYGKTTVAKEMAAKALGISVATLYRKMKEFGID